jgi:hypothetical protein
MEQIFSARQGQEKGAPSEKSFSSTATTQTRYVTVLSPKSVGPTGQSSPSYRHTEEIPGQSRYMSMLLELEEMPWLHNVFANLFTWLLLAGYIVFPATFTTLRKSNAVNSVANHNHAGEVILDKFQNLPLLIIAGICCFVGVSGIAALWWIQCGNYVWLVNRIFL